MESEEREYLKAALRERRAEIGPCLNEELIVAFYSGQLVESEEESVRDHLAECPECLEMSRDARQFLKAMNDPAAAKKRPAQAIIAPARARQQWSSLRRSLLHRFDNPILGLALASASMLLIVASSILAIEVRRLQGRIERLEAGRPQQEQELRQLLAEYRRRSESLSEELKQEQSRWAEIEKELSSLKANSKQIHGQAPAQGVVAALVLSPVIRDPGRANELVISPDAKSVRIQVNLERDDHPRYHAELRTGDGDEVRKWSGLRARRSGSGKAIALDSTPGLFTKRDYVLTINGATAKGGLEEVRQYTFSVVRR
jgi:hypothetical protein